MMTLPSAWSAILFNFFVVYKHDDDTSKCLEVQVLGGVIIVLVDNKEVE
jgi:hypothetical protein